MQRVGRVGDVQAAAHHLDQAAQLLELHMYILNNILT
jgi:hypothetical protein